MVPALWTTTGQTSPVTHFEVVRQCSSILLLSERSPQPPDNVQQNHNNTLNAIYITAVEPV